MKEHIVAELSAKTACPRKIRFSIFWAKRGQILILIKKFFFWPPTKWKGPINSWMLVSNLVSNTLFSELARYFFLIFLHEVRGP